MKGTFSLYGFRKKILLYVLIYKLVVGSTVAHVSFYAEAWSLILVLS